MHEIITPVQAEVPLDKNGLERLVQDFESLYEAKYGKGSAYRDAGIEMTQFRLTASGLIERPQLGKEQQGSSDAAAAKTGQRQVYSEKANAYVEADIYDFEKLNPGNQLSGPAIIHTPITTIVVQQQQIATMDSYRNVRIEGERT